MGPRGNETRTSWNGFPLCSYVKCGGATLPWLLLPFRQKPTVAAPLARHQRGDVDRGEQAPLCGERLGQRPSGPDLILHPHQHLFEVDVLDPADDDLYALEDGVPRPDQRHELLIEHDEVFVLDLFFHRMYRNLNPLPISLNGQDAESFILKMSTAFIMGGSKE